MNIKILDKCKVDVEGKKDDGSNIGLGDKIEVATCVAKKSFEDIKFVGADKILQCERVKSGTLRNCALCQGVDEEIFQRCKNKWANY